MTVDKTVVDEIVVDETGVDELGKNRMQYIEMKVTLWASEKGTTNWS